MPKAVLKNGMILPVEPLPPEWREGEPLQVESASDDEDKEFEAWLNELQTLIAQNDPSDLARVEKSIQDADLQAKAFVRKEMGLP